MDQHIKNIMIAAVNIQVQDEEMNTKSVTVQLKI